MHEYNTSIYTPQSVSFLGYFVLMIHGLYNKIVTVCILSHYPREYFMYCIVEWVRACVRACTFLLLFCSVLIAQYFYFVYASLCSCVFRLNMHRLTHRSTGRAFSCWAFMTSLSLSIALFCTNSAPMT